jgi:hypothetical protein
MALRGTVCCNQWAVKIEADRVINPDALPPDVHLFTAPKQPWVVILDGMPAFAHCYEQDEREKLWPAEGLARRQVLLPLIEAYQASLRGAN